MTIISNKQICKINFLFKSQYFILNKSEYFMQNWNGYSLI